MKKKTITIIYIIIAILLIFAVTNPNVESFKAKFDSSRNEVVERSNYILFSTFKQDILISGQTLTLKHIGILGFFITYSNPIK